MHAGNATDLKLDPFGTHPEDDMSDGIAILPFGGQMPMCWDSAEHFFLGNAAPGKTCLFADVRLILKPADNRMKRLLVLVHCTDTSGQALAQKAAVQQRLDALRGAVNRCMPWRAYGAEHLRHFQVI